MMQKEKLSREFELGEEVIEWLEKRRPVAKRQPIIYPSALHTLPRPLRGAPQPRCTAIVEHERKDCSVEFYRLKGYMRILVRWANNAR